MDKSHIWFCLFPQTVTKSKLTDPKNFYKINRLREHKTTKYGKEIITIINSFKKEIEKEDSIYCKRLFVSIE
jgi:hypothetical protein